MKVFCKWSDAFRCIRIYNKSIVLRHFLWKQGNYDSPFLSGVFTSLVFSFYRNGSFRKSYLNYWVAGKFEMNLLTYIYYLGVETLPAFATNSFSALSSRVENGDSKVPRLLSIICMSNRGIWLLLNRSEEFSFDIRLFFML